jgi:hypothetical protein
MMRTNASESVSRILIECSACMICVLDKYYFTFKHVFIRKCIFFISVHKIVRTVSFMITIHVDEQSLLLLNVAAAEYNLRYFN